MPGRGRPRAPAGPPGHTGGGREATMPRLVIGSRNKKKLEELQDLLGDLSIEITDLSPWPDVPDAEETGQTFEENAPLPDDRRAAYYVCVAALASPDGEVKAVAEGRCHGVIVKEERGNGGFGYD